MGPNFATLYSASSIMKWGLPVAEGLHPADGTFRKLHLKWSEIDDRLPDTSALAFLLVCCDVLVLDKVARLSLPTLIFARRVEVGKDAYFIMDRTDSTRKDFQLVAQTIVDAATGHATTASLTVMSKTDDGRTLDTDTEMASRPGHPATAYHLAKGKREVTAKLVNPGWAAEDFLAAGDPLPIFLKTLFQVACLVSTDDDGLATKQLQWIASLTSRDAGSRDLSADAHNLYQTLISLRVQRNGAILVPQIDHSVYAEASQACMVLLRQRVARYEDLKMKISNGENWQDSFKTTIADKRNEFQLTQRLEQQARDTAEDAAKARQEAAQLVVEEKAVLADLKVDFDRGVEDWRRDETIKGAIDIALSVTDLLTQIPAIVASGGALAAMPVTQMLKGLGQTALDVAADGLKRGVNTIKSKPGKRGGGDDDDAINMDFIFDEDLDLEFITEEGGERSAFSLVNATPEAAAFAKAYESDVELYKMAKAERAQQMDKLEKGAKAAVAAGKDVKGIYDGAMRIADAAATAERLEAQSEKILTKVTLATETSFGSIEPIGIDTVTGGAQVWDLMLTEMELIFDKMGPLLAKISNGLEYRTAMRRMVIKGKVMSAARLSLAKANSDLADARLRLNAAAASIRIYEEQLEKVEHKIARDEAMEQLAFGRLLDSKRGLYQAMEAYTRAFAYFTLNTTQGPSLLPKITDDVDAFERKISRMTGTWLTDVSLGAPPQSMLMPIVLDPEEMETDADGTYRFAIPHDASDFADLHRVRLSRIRVYLDGFDDGDAVSVSIRSSGSYQDKTDRGQVLNFVSQPFAKRFVYQPGQEDRPIVEADVIERFERDFFQPTPFSTWSLAFKTRSGNAIPAERIGAIRLELHGNTISNG